MLRVTAKQHIVKEAALYETICARIGDTLEAAASVYAVCMARNKASLYAERRR